MREYYQDPRRELKQFKTEINLVHFAHSKGFEVDQKESFRNGTVMRHGGEKICVTRDTDGHWIFCDARTGEGGSIVDFAQKLSGASLGHLRKELRVWVGKGVLEPSMGVYEAPRPISRLSSQSILSSVAKMSFDNAHKYLTEHRGIPAEVLGNQLFQNTVRIDSFGNCVFCHVDQDGITGFEMRNVNFRGFSEGGRKSFWRSNLVQPVKTIIFTESPIDAMSHFALKTPQNALYVATSGSLSSEGGELLQALVGRFSGVSQCVLATDNDSAGEKHAEKLQELIHKADSGIQCVREMPDLKDWNEDLQALKPTQ